MTFEEAREVTKAGWIVAKYMALDEAIFRFKRFILFDAPLGFCVAYICDDNLSASSTTRPILNINITNAKNIKHNHVSLIPSPPPLAGRLDLLSCRSRLTPNRIGLGLVVDSL